MSRSAEETDLIRQVSAQVYNRILLKACGHIVIDEIALERGKPWHRVVTMMLEETGRIQSSAPKPIGVLDREGLKTFEAKARDEAKKKADVEKEADLRRRQQMQRQPQVQPKEVQPKPASTPDDPFGDLLVEE